MILNETSIVNMITKIRSRIVHQISIDNINFIYGSVYMQVVNTYKFGAHLWIDGMLLDINLFNELYEDEYDCMIF